MTHLEALPPLAALLIALLVVCGSSLALLGSVGLVRLRSFYQRIHAPTLCYSYGTFLIILASMAMFSLAEARPVLHEFVIGGFMLITPPISLLMLGRAALRRDRDVKLGHDEVVPPHIPASEAPEGAPRDLTRYGAGPSDEG
ncbi:monovalent cation/H(+) antiporter subunit G [Paracoccus ravus]|uniref:monovalent cation/H(+) antiporter subunit G n=1 Tax=Paracoccus ravus TaxID=2447760 RepID=UPI00106DE777|nr:monovalent cation/H(+) antiporter subunit G [Paracoccus ravus]